MALNEGGDGSELHNRFLRSCQRGDGLLSDHASLPVNTAWTALAYVAAPRREAADDQFRQRIVEGLLAAAGVQLENSPVFRQNNKLRGWSWVPDTFSWIEPTSWCLIALKRASRAGLQASAEVAAQRIAEGEAVLIDRACESGGWNYGNANAFGVALPAHIPTTALALIALQDKPDHPVVRRGLAFIEAQWTKERSGAALALTLMCLRIFGRPPDEVAQALAGQWRRTEFLGNLATAAMACCALTPDESAVAPLKVIS